MGIWADKMTEIADTEGIWPFQKLVVSKEKLKALDYVDKIKMAYDPETPEIVVKTLKNDVDNSVVLAAHQRPRVLSGDLRNPFEA